MLKKRIMEILTALDNANVEIERVRFMASQLDNMFADTKKDNATKVYEWDQCGKISDIEICHVAKLDEHLQKAYALLEELHKAASSVEERIK